MAYRLHRVDVNLRRDRRQLEEFLNGLDGDVVAVLPNVTIGPFWVTKVDFVVVVERTA